MGYDIGTPLKGQAMKAGDSAKADRALERYREYPENLGLGKPFPKEE